MPDQNKTNPAQDQTVTTNPPPVVPTNDQSPVPEATPMPDFQSAMTDIPPIPQDNPQTTTPAENTGGAGSATPTDLPDVIPPTPKKKFGGGKIIATILGFLILTGGIVGGVVLTQQQQNIRERADDVGGVPGDQNRVDLGACSTCPAGTHPDWSQVNSSCCKMNPFPQYQGPVCCDLSNSNNTRRVTGCEGAGMVIQQVASCVLDAPPGTAQCQNIKAYDTEWTLITAAQLSQLTVGSQVNFCVRGTTSEGVFNLAQFTINTVQQAETTTVRPGSTNEFCQLYTIPAATTTFNVTAQIHHTALGWK